MGDNLENKNYSEMSDVEKIENNEHFFSELKERYSEYDRRIGTLIDQISQKICYQADISEIKNILLDSANKKIGNLDGRYVECLKLLEIAELEIYFGLPCLFAAVNGLDELLELVTVLRFYIRRIEYGFKYDEWKGIAELIDGFGVSFVFLCKLCLEKTISRKSYVIEQLSKLYEDIGRKNESMLILTLFESIGKKNEKV